MKLVIFSPAVVASAIGRANGLVTQALKHEGHDVVVVRSEDHPILPMEARELGVPLMRWDEERKVSDAVQAADAVIYQVGDNLQFHRGCLEWLPRAPGIVCLHDYFVGHLFAGWAANKQSAAREIVRTWYGDSVAARYFSPGGPSLVERTAGTAPMTEWIAAFANGVIVHSSWAIDRVLRACPGPVRVVPLAYDAPPAAPSGAPHGPLSGKLNVLTVGHVNPNKRAESVLRAIGQSDRLRVGTTYELVGSILPPIAETLRDLANNLAVELRIAGEVSDARLREAVDAADIVCCLRYPALEGASASAIEAMLSGKAVVVMDTGFYRELPDECVMKVSPHREVADLTRALEFLADDPDRRAAMGRRAAAWAGRTFRADNYAQALLQMASGVAAAAPALAAGRYYTDTMLRWGATEITISAPDIVGPLRILEAPTNRTRFSRAPSEPNESDIVRD